MRRFVYVGDLSMAARQLLVWVLRITGVTMSCALVFIFCPFGWTQAIHERIGMGELCVYAAIEPPDKDAGGDVCVHGGDYSVRLS